MQGLRAFCAKFTSHYLADDRQLAEHLAQQRTAPAEPRPASEVEFYLVAELVDLDAEAIELDLMLPIVADWYRLRTLGDGRVG